MPDLTDDLIGRCPNCQTAIRRSHPYAWCSNCGNSLPDDIKAALKLPAPSARTRAEADAAIASARGPHVTFRRFASSFQSWDTLFTEAAEFATKVGRERLVNISHSADHDQGVVTVWYWSA